MKQRVHFELHQGPAAQFCDVTLDGKSCTREFGPLGRPPKRRTGGEYEDEAAALKAFKHQVRRLELKKYVAGHQNFELLRAIQHEPDVLAPYLVYADWLSYRNDPRGELISMMAEGQSAADVFIEQHEATLFPSQWKEFATDARWLLGFLQSISVGMWHTGALTSVLRHPSSFVLQELVLRYPSLQLLTQTRLIDDHLGRAITLKRLKLILWATRHFVDDYESAVLELRERLPHLQIEFVNEA